MAGSLCPSEHNALTESSKLSDLGLDFIQPPVDCYITVRYNEAPLVTQAMPQPVLDPAIVDRVIEMAWEDRTPFEAIEYQFGLSEKQVIALMRRTMKPSSFRMWRKRVSGRKTKHAQRREQGCDRFRCATQKQRIYGAPRK